MRRHVTVIAEVGVNHNGDARLASSHVAEAAKAGADVVKFQTFRSKSLVAATAKQASYQTTNTGKEESQLDMIARLELAPTDFQKVAAECRERGIEFLSTPFDVASVDDVVALGVRTLKFPSGELTNPLLLRAFARTGLPIWLSTGMASLGEVEQALGVIAAEWLGIAGAARDVAPLAFRHPDGLRLLRERVTVMHCTTEYPAPFDEVNLRAMTTLGAAFGLPIGYSDHTPGIAVSLAAVALGATVIEKHFTLDRNLEGPDHKASLEPHELRALVEGTRAIEASLGDGVKRATKTEIPNISVARRSLVAARAIAAGEAFSAENLTVKRPGHGVSAMLFDEYVGRVSPRAYAADELIERL